MQEGATDTVMPGATGAQSADTATGGARLNPDASAPRTGAGDTASGRENQPRQPVTSKSDTMHSGADSAGHAH
jgi:hypothetical protein